MNTIQADLIIRSRDGSPICMVEVYNPINLSCEVAIDLRSDMIAHGILANASYFMILSQEKGFLWKESRRKNPNALPALEFPMEDVIKRYWPRISKEDRLGSELEFIVFQWLDDLAANRLNTETEPEKSLASYGFLKAINRATVTFGVLL